MIDLKLLKTVKRRILQNFSDKKMNENQFIEKQYLGLNKMSISRRMSLAIFCFIAYYWRENHDKSGDLFFLMGMTILVISVILIFILINIKNFI